MSISDRVVFLRQLKENFIHTGAVTPSSRFLAKAIVSEFSKHPKPSKILEVGPGTGVFTREIVRWMSPEDELHICEINPTFAKRIEEIVATEPLFEPVRKKISVFACPLQTLTASSHYDYIISSLPLNNFPIELVQGIQSYFISHLTNGGTLSYFEYMGIRRMKIQFLSGEEKRKLKELDTLLRGFVKQNQVRYNIVPFNIPPAYARHLRF